MKKNIYPKLTLIGAGPGDPDLITIKGLQALKSADIVLYDALVNKELLNQVSDSVPKIYVGKRNKVHTYSQDEINRLIVSAAFTYGHVVRLKGGDSFVFGRGMEEISYAKAFKLETQVIPGVSSSIGVPALNGIPVTHRGVSESFWVITGTTKENTLSKDILVAAETNATIVVLMGLSKLKEITDVFVSAGKEALPVAVIQNGSLPDQITVLGTIETITENAAHAKVKAPAIIVIGEVVKQHDAFQATLSNLSYLSN